MIILLLCFPLILFSAENQHNAINFTQEEISWLKNNPTVKVGGELDWPLALPLR